MSVRRWHQGFWVGQPEMPSDPGADTVPDTLEHIVPFVVDQTRGVVPRAEMGAPRYVRPQVMRVGGKVHPLRIGVAEARKRRSKIERYWAGRDSHHIIHSVTFCA